MLSNFQTICEQQNKSDPGEGVFKASTCRVYVSSALFLLLYFAGARIAYSLSSSGLPGCKNLAKFSLFCD